ncbi:MAG: SLC13 family permease [Candidatus Binatia bacterium]|nr:MAG: SLC13 family permease [Candidatus Binatia bacterium]
MAAAAEFRVDTRPLWIVLLSRSRPFLLLVVGALLALAVGSGPPPEGLTVAGQKALAVFVLCAFYWVFHVLPLMITSLLALVLLPLSGAMSTREAYALFGNEAVFFILGAFILAACTIRSGLSTRVAVVVLRRFGTTPRLLLGSVLLLNAGMSFLMSEHAVAAMNFPIVLEIVAVLGLQPRRSSYGKALFLAMAWGSTIGGIATLLGGGRAPLALEILRHETGQSFSFVGWSLPILPLVFALLAVAYGLLLLFYPVDVTSVRAADEALEEKVLALGRVRGQEWGVGAVVVLTFAAWVLLGEEFGLANVALAAVVALFVLRLVSWRDVEGYVNWGIVLMYGGAICLGSALYQSGAARWLAERTVSRWAESGGEVVALLSLVAILATETMSNSAVVAFLMPVSLGIAAEFGLDPRVMALTVAVPAGLAFTLPIGTPANAIAFSSGHLRMRDLALPGIVLNVTAWILFNLVARWYWPWLGLEIGGGR